MSLASTPTSKASRTSAAGSPVQQFADVGPPPAYTSSSAGSAARRAAVEKDKKRAASPSPSNSTSHRTNSNGSQRVASPRPGSNGGLGRAYHSMTPTPRSQLLSLASLPGSEHAALHPQSTGPRSMLDIAHQQVVESTAFRAISALRRVGELKIGIYTRPSDCTPDEQTLSLDIAHAVANSQRLNRFLFALLAQSDIEDGRANIVVVASAQYLVEKAAALVQAKFLGRVTHASLGENIWFGVLEPWVFVPAEANATTFDAEALLHILRRIAQDETVLDPLIPPPGSRSINDILESARAQLQRLQPREAFDECIIFNNPDGAVLVDIRPAAQRATYGEIPGALVIERNVLEWRFDPRCEARLDIATRYNLRVIVFCQEGYTSSLAAASLLDLGLKNATDIVGGFKAWKDAGLPTSGGPSSEA
ncbi:hypothetical protein EXIGLDRAFT_725750 [Exidia glandulosa HHB12029]|uniref:Rhodanese domain-containing protein n=1 Tax=Exidia glandulosa HHB12029 TaxID=1314781 RepID=A0A165Q9R5_EXIGL|nr:hypothetical protein EXIGLDRAFT_725750 [Exidia glandulosa HHB12029]